MIIDPEASGPPRLLKPRRFAGAQFWLLRGRGARQAGAGCSAVPVELEWVGGNCEPFRLEASQKARGKLAKKAHGSNFAKKPAIVYRPGHPLIRSEWARRPNSVS